jgi:hypothetical protein
MDGLDIEFGIGVAVEPIDAVVDDSDLPGEEVGVPVAPQPAAIIDRRTSDSDFRGLPVAVLLMVPSDSAGGSARQRR